MRDLKPDFEIANSPVIRNAKFALVVAKWNKEFNEELLQGALATLAENNVAPNNVDVFYVPGALEIPLAAQRLADTEEYDAILCFATIIRGETMHFEIVANESARGLTITSLDYDIPVLNGILAVENEEQAEARASRDHENKGREVALSALSFIETLNRIDPDEDE